MNVAQGRAARLLGQGWTRSEVARELEVSVATLSRWRHLPDFKRTEELASTEAISEEETVRTMLLNAINTHPDWKVRIGAARELREWTGKSSEPVESGDILDGYID